MNFLQRILKTKRAEKPIKNEPTVVTTRDAAKHMQETRTIIVPKYDEKKEKDVKISMFH